MSFPFTAEPVAELSAMASGVAAAVGGEEAGGIIADASTSSRGVYPAYL
jgi:hypothetical protein